MRKAALSIGKKTAKTVVKHPVASGATAVALSNLDIVGNAAGDAKEIFSAFRSLAPYFEKICGVFKPLIDFFKSHPIYASALGAIGYGLLRTYPLWWPYMRRLGYELTSGDVLAKCIFEANGSSWTFEYGSSKNKWVLLNAGKIASPEDSISFMKTRFA